MIKNLKFVSIMIGFVALLSLLAIFIPGVIYAQELKMDSPTLVHNGKPTFCGLYSKVGETQIVRIDNTKYEVVETYKMLSTAYTSLEELTDSTPRIAASGAEVFEGMVANNMLAFGTKVRINGKIYTVLDRMHQRKGIYMVDLWKPTLKQAKDYGVQEVQVEVLKKVTTI